MGDHREYLINYFRGREHNRWLDIDEDLLREVVDELEKLHLEDECRRKEFDSREDELRFNVCRAEQHARQAHDLLYQPEGPDRSLWIKMALGRAQSILMSLYRQELRRRT